MKDLKEIKRELGLTDADIGEMFVYKNAHSYYQAARRKHIEAGLVKLYIKIKTGCNSCG